jgi:hypothetical protein
LRPAWAEDRRGATRKQRRGADALKSTYRACADSFLDQVCYSACSTPGLQLNVARIVSEANQRVASREVPPAARRAVDSAESDPGGTHDAFLLPSPVTDRGALVGRTSRVHCDSRTRASAAGDDGQAQARASGHGQNRAHGARARSTTDHARSGGRSATHPPVRHKPGPFPPARRPSALFRTFSWHDAGGLCRYDRNWPPGVSYAGS